MGGMMDFVMLGIMVLGGAAIWVNKDSLGCIFNPSSCGTTGPDCTVDPNAAGCGTDPGGTGGADCGKLCRDKKCTDYKSSCKTGCKYCCSSGPNSPKCSGDTGSQCSSLCSQKNCKTYTNQCEGACTSACANCNSTINTLMTQIATKIKNIGFQGGCSCISSSTGFTRACSISKRCANGQTLTSGTLKLGTYWGVNEMVGALVAGYNSKHPQGCTPAGGCSKTCPAGGYVLDKSSCSCICNPTVKNCTSSSCCLIKDNTTCRTAAAGTGQHGSGSGCNTGYYRCRQSSGLCGCCKSASTPPPPPTGGCTNQTANCRTCGNTTCWHNIGCGKYAGKDTSWCINAQNNCSLARSAWLANICPPSGLAQASGLRGRAQAQGSPGPYGDYRFANTGRAAERVRLAQ